MDRQLMHCDFGVRFCGVSFFGHDDFASGVAIQRNQGRCARFVLILGWKTVVLTTPAGGNSLLITVSGHGSFP
jgi:hypothetical protein